MRRSYVKGSPFIRAPLAVRDGIPVFSHEDAYIENYERIAADHLQSMSEGCENPFIDPALWAELEESTRSLIRRHAPPGALVLDAGVGTGRLLHPFDTLERHGLDISLEYLAIARDHGYHAVFAKIEDTPYRDEMFDIVVSCDVLEHVFDLHRCCAQLVRVLKPGGVLIVRVPYREDLAQYLDASVPYDFVHVRSFDLPELVLNFERIHGCRYVEHTFAARYLQGAPRLALRLLPSGSPVRELLSARSTRDRSTRDDPLALLRRATVVSEEELLTWIQALKEGRPDLFRRVAEHVVLPLIVNAVFTKD